MNNIKTIETFLIDMGRMNIKDPRISIGIIDAERDRSTYTVELELSGIFDNKRIYYSHRMRQGLHEVYSDYGQYLTEEVFRHLLDHLVYTNKINGKNK